MTPPALDARPGGEPDWDAAMQEAIALAASPDAPFGENPRVGCLIVDAAGTVVGRGYHRGAGTAHAEVVALAQAGDRAKGATAVVTLEPCRHTGRTGPCTQAIRSAGIARVVFAQPDPTSEAGGGAAELAAAGIRVRSGVQHDAAAALNREWTVAVARGRPFVTWKVAVSLDGRVAGPGGAPIALTGAAASAAVHELRSRVGAIVVGTGTILADDPRLTVRIAGRHGPAPLRVVVGSRPIPADARVLDGSADTVLANEPSPHTLLADLGSRRVRHVLLEGGPTLAAAFRSAGVIDEVEVYVAPVIVGAGPSLLPADSPGWGLVVDRIEPVGEDVRIVGRVGPDCAAPGRR